MKYSTFLGVALALGITPTALWAGENSAATDNQPMHQSQTAQSYEAQKVATGDRSQAYDQDDQVTPKGLVRASEMMNKAVYNNEDEQVGSIYDVVLDTNSGKIKYVALSTGGFLGIFLGDFFGDFSGDFFGDPFNDL